MAPDTIQDTVNGILKDAVEKASEGADWLAGQVPEVVQQLLIYNLVRSAFLCVVAVAGFCAIVFTLKRVFKHIDKTEEYDPNFPKGMISGVSCISSILFFCMFVGNFTTVLKIWLAPKVYLLEYASNLIK